MTDQIEQLINEHKLTKQAIDNALLEKWPKGSKIQFKINRNQKNFSSGTVYDADLNPGYLRVRHDKAKPGSRFSYRDVHYSQIQG